MRSQRLQHLASLLLDRRGCKNQLSSRRRRTDDLLDPVQTLFIQQSVRLVDDGGAEVRHLQLAPLDQFHDAPGRAHDDVRLGLELVDLPVGRRATDEQHRAERIPRVLRKLAGLTMNLNGQFMRRGDDDHLRGNLQRIDASEKRQQISQRFTGTRLGS